MLMEYLGYLVPVLAVAGIFALLCKPGAKKRGFAVGAFVGAVLLLIGKASA